MRLPSPLFLIPPPHSFRYGMFRKIHHWCIIEMICKVYADLMKNNKQHYKHVTADSVLAFTITADFNSNTVVSNAG